MATFSNEAVLEALRRVQYRQVPWARRPGVFEYLRGLGLMETVRQRTVAPGAGFHAPVDIAVLTDKGRAESLVSPARSARSIGTRAAWTTTSSRWLRPSTSHVSPGKKSPYREDTGYRMYFCCHDVLMALTRTVTNARGSRLSSFV